MTAVPRYRPTEAVWDFLSDLHRNPELARKLMAEILAGTFVELDGRPCLEEIPPVEAATCEQMRLGDAA